MVKVRRHWQDNSGSRVSTGRWAVRIDGKLLSDHDRFAPR